MSALTTRDANLPPTSQPEETAKQAATGEENKPKGPQQYKSMLKQSFASGDGSQNGGAYISPSDAILSPASQKLAGFKQRNIDKQNARNPAARTLFARTASSCSSGFEELDTKE